MTSPLLHHPGAVSGDGLDAAIAAHYGSFNKEQRLLAAGEGFVDLSNREVVRVSGPDRLSWLHSLTTQHLESLPPGTPTTTLILDPQGHVEHLLHLVDDGEVLTAHVEPGRAAGLVEWLDGMRFLMRVEVADITEEIAVMWRPTAPSGGDVPTTGGFDLIARDRLTAYADAMGPPAGRWAYDALRIARGEPRFGIDTDSRAIPNELGLIPGAVHLDKGCYRGQETVARVHTLGRPPRRLTLLHLDGSANLLPAPGAPVQVQGEDRVVGLIGSTARHFELGPIGLALIKRNVEVAKTLEISGITATQETIVDPNAGLHVRPMVR